MTPVPNAHGVYEPQETLFLARTVKGWRGCNLADIKLVDLGTHWIWATDFQMYTGDHSGSGSPLMDLPPGRRLNCRAPTRQAAIEAACAELRRRLEPRAVECKDARAVIEWLDSLIPNQLDLFGAAA